MYHGRLKGNNMTTERKKKTIIENRRAGFEYFIEKEYEAGMVLTGAQLKTILAGKATFSGNSWYVREHNGEMFLEGLHVPIMTEHVKGLFVKNDTIPSIKLLLHKAEITKLKTAVQQKGMTVVPLRITYQHKLKVIIALAKGKNNVDKRETIKARDVSRDIARGM